jgi:hydrogenase/urease accessory protein HupE
MIELLLDKHVPTAMVMHAVGEMGCLHGPHHGVVIRRELGQPAQLISARETEKRWRYI